MSVVRVVLVASLALAASGCAHRALEAPVELQPRLELAAAVADLAAASTPAPAVCVAGRAVAGMLRVAGAALAGAAAAVEVDVSACGLAAPANVDGAVVDEPLRAAVALLEAVAPTLRQACDAERAAAAAAWLREQWPEVLAELAAPDGRVLVATPLVVRCS